MKRILIIADEFHPYANANTHCLDKILDGLVCGGFDVTVLGFAYGADVPLREERRGCHVRRLRISFDRFERFLSCRFFRAANPVSALLFSLFSKLEGIWGRSLKKRRLLCACRAMRSEPFDLLLSGLCPIASHVLAYAAACREKYPWVMYNMDSFVFNCDTGQSIARRKRIERKWCKKATAVINTIGLCAHNAQNGYFPYRDLPADRDSASESGDPGQAPDRAA